jgi:hypothetical protein
VVRTILRILVWLLERDSGVGHTSDAGFHPMYVESEVKSIQGRILGQNFMTLHIHDFAVPEAGWSRYIPDRLSAKLQKHDRHESQFLMFVYSFRTTQHTLLPTSNPKLQLKLDIQAPNIQESCEAKDADLYAVIFRTCPKRQLFNDEKGIPQLLARSLTFAEMWTAQTYTVLMQRFYI